MTHNDPADRHNASKPDDPVHRRRELLKGGTAFAALGLAPWPVRSWSQTAGTAVRAVAAASFDPAAEAAKIAFDRTGHGEKILFLSGFPQTRRSWDKFIPLLDGRFDAIAADLPSFGDSAILQAPATTENVAKIFHEFVAKLGAPLHVVAHDFGAWVAYSWALQFPTDLKSLTLIDAGIPGVTLTEDVPLSDYFRKWNFVFQMLPDLPAELVKGREDLYVGWWFKNKVRHPGAIPTADAAAYAAAYAREGRMDAAFDYCRKILEDMRFNSEHSRHPMPIKLLAVGGQYAIPAMGPSLKPFFDDVTSVVIPDSGHFVPEEQPAALAAALLKFLQTVA